MPIRWRRIIDSVAFILAVAVAGYARYGFDASWYAAGGLAVIVYLLPPFVVSRLWANYLIRRMERAARQMHRDNPP
jgi:hypothetical protein